MQQMKAEEAARAKRERKARWKREKIQQGAWATCLSTEPIFNHTPAQQAANLGNLLHFPTEFKYVPSSSSHSSINVTKVCVHCAGTTLWPSPAQNSSMSEFLFPWSALEADVSQCTGLPQYQQAFCTHNHRLHICLTTNLPTNHPQLASSLSSPLSLTHLTTLLPAVPLATPPQPTSACTSPPLAHHLHSTCISTSAPTWV